MLRNCYFSTFDGDWSFDLVRALSSGNKRVAVDQARETFYRVTGKPFNSVPLPSMYNRFGRWMNMEQDFTWDEGLAAKVSRAS